VKAGKSISVIPVWDYTLRTPTFIIPSSHVLHCIIALPCSFSTTAQSCNTSAGTRTNIYQYSYIS